MNSDIGRIFRASDWPRILLLRFVFEDAAAALWVTCMGKSGISGPGVAVGDIQDNGDVISPYNVGVRGNGKAVSRGDPCRSEY